MRSKRELPAEVVVGLRLQHICKCETPTPGTYVVVRVGAGRKMAWLEHEDGGPSAILRAPDFTRTWGERYEPVASARSAPAAQGGATPQSATREGDSNGN